MSTATLQPLGLRLSWLRVIFQPLSDILGVIAVTVLHPP